MSDRTIIVVLEKGLVRCVENIPPDVEVEVRNYDVDQDDEALNYDDEEQAYTSAIYGPLVVPARKKTMLLSFTLSMPSNNAWNGKWTGEKNYYAVVINFGRTKKAEEEARKILNQRYYQYDFGDGWVAGITVKEVDASQARKVRQKSRGFYGYDWMIESIRAHGKILVKADA